MDPHDQTGLIKLCARDLDEMVARVHQGRTPAGAVVLVGVRVTHHHKGIALVAGGTPHTAHAVGALGQVGPHRLPLPGVGAAQGDVVLLPCREVQTQGHHTGQGHRVIPAVVHSHRPCDHVLFLQYTIQEGHFQPGVDIFQHHFQGLGGQALVVKAGHAGNGVLAVQDVVGHIAPVHRHAPIGKFSLQAGGAEVAHVAGGVLLGDGVQGVGAVGPRLIGVGGKASVFVTNQPEQVALSQPFPIVGVEQDPLLVHFHLIRGVGGVKGQGIGLLVKLNHGESSFYFPPVRAMPSMNWRWKMR